MRHSPGLTAIAGVGMTPFGRLEGSLVELGVEAARAALDASGASIEEIDGLVLGTFAGATLGGQGFAAAVTAARLGLRDRPAFTVEAACASGSVALRQAVTAIEARRASAMLVVGAEKMTGQSTAEVTDVLARASDTDSKNFRAGLTFPGFFALVAAAYLDEYGIKRDLLADVTIKNRAFGARNPRAQFTEPVTREEVLHSRTIAEPLRLLDCSPISDGAAAVVVATAEWARAHADQPVSVLACEHANGPAAADDINSFVTIAAATAAARAAYRAAGIEPADIDIAEVHDCFSIAEWVALEDLGLCERGCASAATSAGETSLTGRIPTNPSGGLLSKGHPVGATGVAQLVEVVEQLRGVASNQVETPELGLTHNVGGTGGLAGVTILGRER